MAARKTTAWHDQPLYRDLAKDVGGPAKRVIVGLNWTLVEGDGGVGLAHTPVRGTSGCFALPDSGEYRNRDLAALASGLGSANVFESAIALAAINAFHNRAQITGSRENGLDLIEGDGSDTVVIGRFPGLDDRLPACKVIERAPRPGDYPEADAPKLLPQCRHLVITASALQSGALPGYLALAPSASVILLGPGTPFAPLLRRHGVAALSGFIADDADGLAQVVAEGGAVRAMKRHGHILTVRTNDA